MGQNSQSYLSFLFWFISDCYYSYERASCVHDIELWWQSVL
jgi:hypothetical protein